MKILIVEDEPFAQDELKRLLSKALKENTYEIVACLDSVEDSVIWLEENPQPDLVFMDIQLSDGLSFEIFEHVDIPVPIIFTTAYDEYAIKAFKLNSIDYLLKPIKFVALKNAVSKFETIKGQYVNSAISTNGELRDKLLNRREPDYKMRFVAKIGDQIRHISIEDTSYFYAEDNLVYLVSTDNKHFIIDYSLEQLTKVLNPDLFFRATRSHIVKIDSIKKVHKYFNSRLKLELIPPFKEEVLVPRAKVNAFIEWMDK